MIRTLTAGATFVATLGLAALAQAQTAPSQPYDGKQNYETPGKPSAGYQIAPSAASSPALPNPSDPYTRTNMPAMPAQPQSRPTNQ